MYIYIYIVIFFYVSLYYIYIYIYFYGCMRRMLLPRVGDRPTAQEQQEPEQGPP